MAARTGWKVKLYGRPDLSIAEAAHSDAMHRGTAARNIKRYARQWGQRDIDLVSWWGEKGKPAIFFLSDAPYLMARHGRHSACKARALV